MRWIAGFVFVALLNACALEVEDRSALDELLSDTGDGKADGAVSSFYYAGLWQVPSFQREVAIPLPYVRPNTLYALDLMRDDRETMLDFGGRWEQLPGGLDPDVSVDAPPAVPEGRPPLTLFYLSKPAQPLAGVPTPCSLQLPCPVDALDAPDSAFLAERDDGYIYATDMERGETIRILFVYPEDIVPQADLVLWCVSGCDS